MDARPAQPDCNIPQTVDQAIDHEWLSMALAPASGEARVTSVELVQVIEKFASMIRIAVRFGNRPGVHSFCMKFFVGWERDPVTVREARFYREIAPNITMRVPRFVNAIFDREGERCVLIMEDVIAAGARFRSVLEPFTTDEVALGLDQLARLHAGAASPETKPWLPRRILTVAGDDYLAVEDVQAKLDDSRGDTLDARTRDARLLFAGIRKLAAESDSLPQSVVHGDCHAGNVYMTASGPGFADWQLVQRGNWSYDVAYHIGSVLPAAVAEREERALLDHYLDAVRSHGGRALDREEAWELYRRAQLYGFFHWAITRSVGPEIRDIATERLGAGVARHDTYRLLDL